MKTAAIYVGVHHGNLVARGGYEQGSFQAEIQKGLNNHLSNLGVDARVTVAQNGHYAVFVGGSLKF